jgi:hypothetical protein
VEAHSRKCSGLLPRGRSGRSLPLSWWSRRRWKPLTLSCLLLRTRRLISGTSVAARRGWSHLPLLILNILALTLGVEGSINQLVETVEAVVQQRVLDVIIQSLLEILLLVAITGDVSRGIAGQLKETVTVLRHRHRSLK